MTHKLGLIQIPPCSCGRGASIYASADVFGIKCYVCGIDVWGAADTRDRVIESWRTGAAAQNATYGHVYIAGLGEAMGSARGNKPGSV